PLVGHQARVQEDAQMPAHHRRGRADLPRQLSGAVRLPAQQLHHPPARRVGEGGEHLINTVRHGLIVAHDANNWQGVEHERSLSYAAVPMLAYENASKAIDFLVTAFGFTERFRLTDDDGRIGHAELTHGKGVIMLVDFGNGYESPNTHAQHCE